MFSNSNELAVDIWVETGIINRETKSIANFLNGKLTNKEIKSYQLLDYLIINECIFISMIEMNIKSQDFIESLKEGLKFFEIEYPSPHIDGFISCFSKWFALKENKNFENQEILYLIINWYSISNS